MQIASAFQITLSNTMFSASRAHCCSIGFRRVSRSLSSETSSAQAATKEPKIKRIGNYFKRIYEDYKFATAETFSVLKQKPVKSSIYLTTAGTSLYLFRHNPSISDFNNHLVSMTTELTEVSDLVRNKTANEEVQKLIHLNNEGRLRRFTLGVCSFIYWTELPEYSRLYEAQCKEVKMKWRDFPSHVVDVGVLNRWIWTEKYMIDYDVNPAEWAEESKSDSLQNNS